jgi:UDP-glucose 4-epimerase
MPQKQTVLITGVGGYWGARVATRLLDRPEVHVIGLDVALPKDMPAGLDFIQADIRNPLLPDLLRDEQVDVICHLALMDTDGRSEAAFDYNVMGTMKVFGAAVVAGVSRIVLRSSTMVYGARAENSAFLVEEQPLANGAVEGTIAHLVEIEAFCNGFRGQNPDVGLSVLRFANIIGPTADTPFVRFLRLPLPPFLMGFDPMMQVIHEDDVVDALIHAVFASAEGTANVAAEDVLPLSRILGLAGKLGVPIFHLAAYWGNPLLAGLGLPIRAAWPISLNYLRYPWVGDLTRMRAELGFVPRYTAAEALREFAGRERLKNYPSAGLSLTQDENRLRDTLERRKRARQTFAVERADDDHAAPFTDEVEEDVL